MIGRAGILKALSKEAYDCDRDLVASDIDLVDVPLGSDEPCGVRSDINNHLSNYTVVDPLQHPQQDSD